MSVPTLFLYMKTIRSLIHIGSALFLSACATSPTRDQFAGTKTTLLSSAETYINTPSNFQFPSMVAGFERAQITKFDPQGQDVGIGFNHLAHKIAMTVYVYPIPQGMPEDPIRAHFGTCKYEILKRHAGAQPISEQSVKISVGGSVRSGKRATFSYSQVFAHQHQAVLSDVYLFRNGQRFIKYRVTYPIGAQSEAKADIHNFMSQLLWP